MTAREDEDRAFVKGLIVGVLLTYLIVMIVFLAAESLA